MKKELQISEELADIITALTVEFDIDSISESGTTSTLTVNTLRIFDNLCDVMYLQDGMIVTVNDKNYQVSNVAHALNDTFDIEETGLIATKWNVAANFQTGTRTEINEILSQQRTDDNKFIRFPLIWYIFSDNQDFDNEVVDFESTINLAFAYFSNNTDKTSVRIENSIKPIIQPLVKLFLLWIQSSDFNYMFEFGGKGKPIDYSLRKFPFYGASDGKKNVLETSTDAIELELDLKFKKQFEY